MLSLQRECKFSKIHVFIISVIFSNKRKKKETKNEGFWDEVGSKIHVKNVLKFDMFFQMIFDGFWGDLGRVWGVFSET